MKSNKLAKILPEPVAAPVRSPSRTRLVINRIGRRPTGVISLFLCILTLTLALIGPYITPEDPFHADVLGRLALPSLEHLMGTDALGRDLFSRILYGFRPTLTVGLIAVGFSSAIGIFLGLIGGYQSNILSLAIMRSADLLLAFPWFLLILTIVSMLGPSLQNVVLALGVTLIPHYIRLARGLTLSIREREYVQAARGLAEKELSILLRYILPNTISPLLIQITLDIPRTIMAGAALGFLGLGTQPPEPEWGIMLSDAREYLTTAPHIVAFPALALMIVTLSFNVLGDTLRDVLDPRIQDVVK